MPQASITVHIYSPPVPKFHQLIDAKGVIHVKYQQSTPSTSLTARTSVIQYQSMPMPKIKQISTFLARRGAHLVLVQCPRPHLFTATDNFISEDVFNSGGLSFTEIRYTSWRAERRV